MTALEEKAFCFPLIVDLRKQGKANRSSNPQIALGAPDGIPWISWTKLWRISVAGLESSFAILT